MCIRDSDKTERKRERIDDQSY
ncbi:hypothetical protein A5868_002510, partial [Enterococcus sp. 12F9_DIV0723]